MVDTHRWNNKNYRSTILSICQYAYICISIGRNEWSTVNHNIADISSYLVIIKIQPYQLYVDKIWFVKDRSEQDNPVNNLI